MLLCPNNLPLFVKKLHFDLFFYYSLIFALIDILFNNKSKPNQIL